MSDTVKTFRSVCGLLLFPIVHFYLLEAYTHNGFTEVRQWPQIFNILLFELVAWILALLFRSVTWALRTEGILAMLLGLINYYVYTFRSLPLVPWDLFSIGTAAGVMDNYNFMPTPRVAAVLFGFLLVLFLEGFCRADGKKCKRYVSLPAAFALCVALLLFAKTLQREEFQNRHLMYNKLFTPVYMWQTNGFALTMVMELPFLSIEKPDGYSRTKAEQMLAEYETTQEASANQEQGAERMPNIIVIMDEAFSDPGVLGDFTASEEYMPFVRRLFQGEKNTITGYLHTSVCGGNTANTEFEFLTGHTMAFLPQGSIPYQQYIRKELPAIPSCLKAIGYETYAMHPYYAGGWDRDTVYPLLGFSHMQFLHDFGKKAYIRDYVSDQTCFDQIIRTYEEKEEDTPLFVFNVTMQNHGSYDAHPGFAPHITVEGAPSEALSMYLSLIQETDRALESLISYFSQEEEPTMVVFFGDHQPNDTVAEPIWRLQGKSYRFLSGADAALRYQVPYVIWTNYPMETETQQDMSVNYLGVKVLEAAGIALPAYQNFLRELRERAPVVSAAGIWPKEAKEELLPYQTLQYYQMFDKD